MRKVFKYEILMSIEPFAVMLPEGAIVIHVAEQGMFQHYMWAIVDERRPEMKRTFMVRGTGQPIPDDVLWVGTWHAGLFVWHLFELFPK